jgi:hypothetical protein
MPGKKLVLSLAIVVALLGAIPSVAAEATRESYVDAVEPICKANQDANDKIFQGVRAKVKAGKLDAASKQFFAAAQALKRTRAQLLQVSKPSADSVLLTKWLDYVKKEIDLFEAVGRKLAKGEAGAANRMVVRLVSNARQTNNLVRGFGFRYCQFQISRYI